MASPKEELWLAVNKSEFTSALNIIKSVQKEDKIADLINSTNDNGSSLIMVVLARGKNSFNELIEFILTNPQFDLTYRNKDSANRYNINSILNFLNIDTFKLVLNNPKIHINGDKLSYETAKEQYESRLEDLQEDPDNAKLKAVVETRKQMMDMLGDSSIRFAITNDNVALYQRLVKAGAKLINGDAADLAKKAGKPNLTALLSPTTPASSTTSTPAPNRVSGNPNGLFGSAVDLDAQLKALKLQHANAQKTAYQNGSSSIVSALSSMK